MRRPRRRVLAPQHIDQPIRRHHLIGVYRQHRQHPAPLRSSEPAPAFRRAPPRSARAPTSTSEDRPPAPPPVGRRPRRPVTGLRPNVDERCEARPPPCRRGTNPRTATQEAAMTSRPPRPKTLRPPPPAPGTAPARRRHRPGRRRRLPQRSSPSAPASSGTNHPSRPASRGRHRRRRPDPLAPTSAPCPPSSANNIVADLRPAVRAQLRATHRRRSPARPKANDRADRPARRSLSRIRPDPARFFHAEMDQDGAPGGKRHATSLERIVMPVRSPGRSRWWRRSRSRLGLADDGRRRSGEPGEAGGEPRSASPRPRSTSR